MSITVLGIICSFLCFEQVDTSAHIQGQVLVSHSGEKVFFATVSLYKGKRLIKAVTTDLDGLFKFGPLPSGSYNVEVHYLGMETLTLNGLVLEPGVTTPLQLAMKEKVVLNGLLDLATDVGVQGLSKLIRKLFKKKSTH